MCVCVCVCVCVCEITLLLEISVSERFCSNSGRRLTSVFITFTQADSFVITHSCKIRKKKAQILRVSEMSTVDLGLCLTYS